MRIKSIKSFRKHEANHVDLTRLLGISRAKVDMLRNTAVTLFHQDWSTPCWAVIAGQGEDPDQLTLLLNDSIDFQVAKPWTSSWSLIQPKDHIHANPLFCVIYNLMFIVNLQNINIYAKYAYLIMFLIKFLTTKYSQHPASIRHSEQLSTGLTHWTSIPLHSTKTNIFDWS